MKQCDNILALARELGIHQRFLYTWRDKLEPVDKEGGPTLENPSEKTLRKEVNKLKRLLADKAVELDFLKGALQKVEARRQRRGGRSGRRDRLSEAGLPSRFSSDFPAFHTEHYCL